MDFDFPLPLRNKDVRDARLFADRYDLVRFFSERLQSGVIAELGVAHGLFSEFLIQELNPQRFDAYDLFEMHTWGTYWGIKTDELFENKTHLDFYCEKFKKQIRSGKMYLSQGDGATNLKKSDVYYDMIYIDGDHSRSQVKKDAEAAIGRLKSDGILIFNDYMIYDYIYNSYYGVVYIVNDLCVNHNWKMTAFALHNGMFCDVALERS